MGHPCLAPLNPLYPFRVQSSSHFFGVLTPGSPQLHVEALMDSGHNHQKPEVILFSLPQIPVIPGTAVPSPAAWKDTLKLEK